jgi:DHA2 family lincomycin resistance protein-like MFS transporter
MASGAGLAFGIGALLMAATIGLAAMIKRPENDGEFSGGH